MHVKSSFKAEAKSSFFCEFQVTDRVTGFTGKPLNPKPLNPKPFFVYIRFFHGSSRCLSVLGESVFRFWGFGLGV